VPNLAGLPRAFRREPSRIQPEAEGSNPISFPRLVQPVLEKHCVTCHGQGGEPPDLRRGNWQQHVYSWHDSYRNLRPYAFHYGAPRDESRKHQYDRWQPARTMPGAFGARASRLLSLVDQGHYDVNLSPDELRRIIVWLDTNSDFFGAYENPQAQARGEVVPPKLQ
jgi:hypothetical protein